MQQINSPSNPLQRAGRNDLNRHSRVFRLVLPAAQRGHPIPVDYPEVWPLRIRNQFGGKTMARFLKRGDGRIALGTRMSGTPSESMTSAAERGLRERLPAS